VISKVRFLEFAQAFIPPVTLLPARHVILLAVPYRGLSVL
jgi:hypothetical protein